MLALIATARITAAETAPALPSLLPADYKGTPFQDGKHPGGPQKIPGMVVCAYYDLGGEGVAYHDKTKENSGSGKLNPANGAYLNEFRKNEAVDTSYTKYAANKSGPDNSPYNAAEPPPEGGRMVQPDGRRGRGREVRRRSALHQPSRRRDLIQPQRQAGGRAGRGRIHGRPEGTDRLAAVASLERHEGLRPTGFTEGNQRVDGACRERREHEFLHAGVQAEVAGTRCPD